MSGTPGEADGQAALLDLGGRALHLVLARAAVGAIGAQMGANSGIEGRVNISALREGRPHAVAGTLAMYAKSLGGRSRSQREDGYGPLQPLPAENTGNLLLALPSGFRYVEFSRTGDVMSDGHAVPVNHDGMMTAAHPTNPSLLRLVRNHEVRAKPGTVAGSVGGPDATKYDPLGVAGTTTVDVDPNTGEVPLSFVSLNGTLANCSGGSLAGGHVWFSCEETVEGPRHGWVQRHGYVFAVPAVGPAPGSPAAPSPLRNLGRFSHEAVAVDPATGVSYLTEDERSRASGFYRFVPDSRGDYSAGRLQMLAVEEHARYDARHHQHVGEELPVVWVPIEQPDPDLEQRDPSVFAQGAARGGASFHRLEGCWFSEGAALFSSTTGGSAKQQNTLEPDGFRPGYGQIWRYRPEGESGSLCLLFESPGGDVLDSPDNLTISPRGGLVVCEDDASPGDVDTSYLSPGAVNVNRLIAIGTDGLVFPLAVNIADTAEFTGVSFSSDGCYLLVNTFGDFDPATGVVSSPARTYAITGPWDGLI